ncbi:hypothetical protein [Lysobacter gummosus]
MGNVNHGAINAPQTFHMKVGGRKKGGRPTDARGQHRIAYGQ